MPIPPQHSADEAARHERATSDRHVGELTRARDEALAAVAAERARVDSAMQQCEHLATEIWSWRRKHEAASSEVRDLGARLAHAQATIHHMERSWFWRARLWWLRVRCILDK